MGKARAKGPTQRSKAPFVDPCTGRQTRGTISVMNVFISWGGDRSKQVALALRTLIEMVIQHAKPWCSPHDMEAGDRWQAEIAKQLEASDYGILCITPENQNRPWVLFEAGALAKKHTVAKVTPYLLDMRPAELQPPLGMFHGVEATKEGTLLLLQSINNALPEGRLPDDALARLFDKVWEDADKELKAIPPEGKKRERSVQDMVEEILAHVRSLARRTRRMELGASYQMSLNEFLEHDPGPDPDDPDYPDALDNRYRFPGAPNRGPGMGIQSGQGIRRGGKLREPPKL